MNTYIITFQSGTQVSIRAKFFATSDEGVFFYEGDKNQPNLFTDAVGYCSKDCVIHKSAVIDENR